MAEMDILSHLKIAAREVAAENQRASRVASLRRYLVAISDILDVYINFQRDQRWSRNRW